MLLRRRDLLRFGLTASTLRILPPGPLFAADAKAEERPKVFLFVDWFHVKKGDVRVTLDPERGVELRGTALAYAESADGWTWTKPALNVLSYRGSRANNLVSPFANAGSVCRDDHGPPQERYKGFFFDELPKAEVPEGAPA